MKPNKDKILLQHLDTILECLTNSEGEKNGRKMTAIESSVGNDLRNIDRMVNRKNVKGLLTCIGDEIDAAIIEIELAKELLS
jgi:hypothetical protein